MDGFDVKDFLNATDDNNLTDLFGSDIFGILDQEQQSQQEETTTLEEEEHVPKLIYSDAKKKRLTDAFRVTYVNDYGKNDPYHIDTDHSLAAQVRNEIHAIYGNRSIVSYIVAMRKVFAVYREMYEKSVHRLVLSFDEYVKEIVSGDIPGPMNHPLVRTNIPDEILLRYILNEQLDPNEILQFVSTPGQSSSDKTVVVDVTNVDRDWNTPIEYRVAPTRIQTRVIKSWLSGKWKKQGLDKNEANLVYGLTSHYDHVGVDDTSYFKFDVPISHYPDVISVKNLLRAAPEHVKLKAYTPEDLEQKRRGVKLRQILNADNLDDTPEITIPEIINRMESKANEINQPVSAIQWMNKYKLYAQGILEVHRNKFGRESYVYRDKSKRKHTSIGDKIRYVEEKAEAFKDLTEEMNERFRSLPYLNLMKEIEKEQDLIRKYGTTYFLDGD